MMSVKRMDGMQMNEMQMRCMCTCRMRNSRTWNAAGHVSMSCCM